MPEAPVAVVAQGAVRDGSTSDATGPAIPNSLALPCAAFAECLVASQAELDDALSLARGSGRPLLPLGGSSNVVLPPYLDAIVLRAADDRLRVVDETADAVVLRVGAAFGWHALVQSTLREGYFGLENLALIPGAVGAAPVQNIGAYGRELEDFVVAVHGFDLESGRARELSRDECAFAYRDSVFKGALKDRFLITAVDLRLSRVADLHVEYPSLKAQMDSGVYDETPAGVCRAVVDLRRRRLPDPDTHPNAGSFFKNPVLDGDALARFCSEHPDAPVHPLADGAGKLSAAWLIERCGLRGLRHGRAGISKRHSLVIENPGGATQQDILQLARHVQETVRGRFAVALEAEPRIFGGVA